MQLKPSALRTLREAMIRRGSRPTVVPPPMESTRPSDHAEHTLEEQAVIERVAPICEALYLLMVADDVCEKAEFELLRGAMRALTDGQLRTQTLTEMLADFAAARASQGREERLFRVCTRLSADRADAEATFLLAAAMSLADGVFDAREAAMLDDLRDLLGIRESRAKELLGEAQ